MIAIILLHSSAASLMYTFLDSQTHGGPGVTFAQENFYFLFDVQCESLKNFAMFY